MSILITGANGFVGKNLCPKLESAGHNIIKISSKDFNLCSQHSVQDMFDKFRPKIVIHLAAKVGGIGANKDNPAEFMYHNLMMGLNTINFAKLYDVKKFIMCGSICAYPKFTPVPFKEEEIWNGYPEETNAPYGIAKKTLMQLLISYYEQYGFKSVNLLPVNMYGPHDSNDLKTNHVIPAIIQKVYNALKNNDDFITIWGTGKVSREFLYVDDFCKAITRAIYYDGNPQPINIGTGHEITIINLTKLICQLMSYGGDIVIDPSKPDGQPRRCLNVQRAKELLDFEAKTDLATGLQKTIEWFCSYKEKNNDKPNNIQ